MEAALILLGLGMVGVAIVAIYRQLTSKDRYDTIKTQELYAKAKALAPPDFADFFRRHCDELHSGALLICCADLYLWEGFSEPPDLPPVVTGIEGGRYRDRLEQYIALAHSKERLNDFGKKLREIVETLNPPEATGIFKGQRALTNQEINDLMALFLAEQEFFQNLRDQLSKNVDEQKGVPPARYTGRNCALEYLKGTPLLQIKSTPIATSWDKPENHTLVLAGSGAGKTTLFKHLIAHLLKSDCCVVVMDSQTELIDELAMLELDDDEMTWITPAYPLALNPFDADPSELKDEAFVNNAIGQLEFVINKLLEAPMTPRQRTLFYHCSRLMLSIPDANIETYIEVLNDPYNFSSYIDKLDPTARRFFNEELRKDGNKGSPYDSTRNELSYRLDALLKNPTLRRIFNAKENTFSMFEEMEASRLILIDTSLALLAEESATFGRFVIAQALQACYRRVKEKATNRPVVFFVDEAHEYFDDKLETMLLQARKANVGMVIATQDLAKASRAGIADTLIGSTSTKLVSQVVAGDARRLASVMKTTADMLLELPDHAFAYSSGRSPAVSIKADSDALGDIPKRENLMKLAEKMAYHYGPDTVTASPNSVSDVAPEPSKPNSHTTMSENEDHDIRPSTEL